MIQYSEIRVHAKKSYAEKNFAEAASAFGELWNASEYQDKSDGVNYARALRKSGRVTEALDVCRLVYQLDSTYEYNNSEYGWCAYELSIKQTDEEIAADETAFFRAADFIVKMTRQSTYSPYERTVFRVLRYLKPHAKQRNFAQRMLDWTNKLDIEMLSTEPETFNREGEAEEGASAREKWYMHRSLALYELREYQPCIETCERALDSFEKLHYGNHIWFKLRIANSKGYLGEPEAAIADLVQLSRFKQEWFIHRDLALWLQELGRCDEAYMHTISAALSHRKGDKLENKWELFLLMGQLLAALGRNELARQHILLAGKLRLEQQWKFTQELTTIARNLGVDYQDARCGIDLFNELQADWQSQIPRLHGQIKMINSEREFGFITGDDKQDYHFRFREFRGSKTRLNRGLTVTFVTHASYDRIKDRESTIAVDIKEVN